MHSQPLISLSVTVGLLQAIKDAGADPSDVLENLDVDPAVFSRAEGFIPCASFARVLERTAELTGDHAFGLRLGARSNPKNIGAIAYAVLNSPTLAAAFETAGRYLHLHNEAAQVAFHEEENTLSYFSFGLKNLDVDEPRQFVEYGMASALNVLRVMVGSQWSPREVQFAHLAPAVATAHREIFRAPVIFACATNAFVM
jgi:hypothetical protein